MSEDEFLTIPELAAKLKCSESTVRANVRTKKWPHKRFGSRFVRFSPEHVAQIEGSAEVPVSAKEEKPLSIKEMVSRLP